MFNYENYERECLKEMGFDYDKLTERQRYVILEPENAPENYYCDGEITSAQADAYYKRKLIDAGLSLKDRKAVLKHYGI
jgi:hypothetical protein